MGETPSVMATTAASTTMAKPAAETEHDHPAPAASTTNKRRSRPLQRKTSHSLIERRRREKINEGLVSLQRLVPACRDELHEMLRTKAHANKRNARKAAHEIDALAEKELSEKVGSQMVLEKLCIISHSVDYVQELQRTVAAYKRICHGSPPPLDDVEGSRISATHAHVHDHEDIGSENADGVDSDSNSNVERGEGERETTLSEERSAGPDDPEVESQESNISATVSGTASAPSGWTRCHAKCQRHWGSNNPIKLNRQQLHSKRRSQSIAELAKEEKMALAHIITDDKRIPTMSGGRAHSVDGETTIQQDVAFSDKVHTCVGCEPSDKLDSDSDLELDEWTPTQSHNGRRYSSRAAFAGSIFSPQKRPCEDVGYLVQSPECETEGPGQPSRSADLYTNKSAYGDVQTPSTKRLRGHHVRGEMARSMDGRVRERDSTDCEDCVSLLSAGRSHTVAFAASKDERQEFTEKDDGPQRIPTGLGLLADLSAQGAQR